MRSALKQLAAATAAVALCVSPTMAAAATAAPIAAASPLVAISVFGTQASAQVVCAEGASTAATAAAAAAAQGQTGCVLPATEAAPPVAQGPAYAPPPPTGGNYGINWLLAGLGALFLIAGLATLFDDDDDNGVPVSAG